MEIALVRVDNRLVHGQILEAWVPFLKATRIAVVDDQVACDFFRETVIRMAVPREVTVTIHSVAEFAAGAAENGRGPKAIVLFSCIADALKACDLGFRFKTLNIGNIYNENCSLCCTPSVLLSDEDIRDVFSLYERGVEIELRRVPREKPLDFRDVVHRRKS